MLKKQICYFDDKKVAVKWIEVPVEKDDIISYLDKRVKYIESDFIYCKNSDFLEDIMYLKHSIFIFFDLDILTVDEYKKYYFLCNKYYEQYKELKNF